jgi:MSHA pilin protein MshC
MLSYIDSVLISWDFDSLFESRACKALGILTMNHRGFTLIELVVVIALIGIMAVFVAPRFVNVSSLNAAAFADKLRADIRYAQNLAMTRNQRYRVYVNTAPAPTPNGYAVVNVSTGVVAPDPAGRGTLSITLNAGQYAGITVNTPPGGFVEFNSLGASTAGADVTIMVNGDATLTVTITTQTGAVN